MLPETRIKGAVILAERIRKVVEKMTIENDGDPIRTTISLGVTVWEPGSDLTDKSGIIDAADKALYRSKNTGRNKVSFIASRSSRNP